MQQKTPRYKKLLDKIKIGQNNIEKRVEQFGKNTENRFTTNQDNFDKSQEKLSDITKSFNTQVTNKIGETSSLKGIVLLLFFAILIISISIKGLLNCKIGIKYAKDEDSKKLILRNEKIFRFSLGFGSGLAVYAIFSKILDTSTIIIPAIIICVMSGITITAFQEISENKNCNKEKIQNSYSLMYGFIGAGIGMILSAGLIALLSKLNFTDIRGPRILAIFLAIILLTLCSFDINTVNNTNDKSPTSKTVSIVILSLAVISIIGLGVSFKYFP